MVTFNERLTAIGGHYTRKVEVYQDGRWNDRMIPEVGDKLTSDFTSLVIQSQLYVFGNIPVFNQD